MYKKSIICLFMIYAVFWLGAYVVKSTDRIQANGQEPVMTIQPDEALPENESTNVLGIQTAAVSGQRVVECSRLEKKEWAFLDEEEIDMLRRIVEAEAGCEDEDGKLLVANVVLNRVKSENFPDTVKEVVLQKNKGVAQFSPADNGRLWKVQISEETVDAVSRALDGEDISQGALFFVARQYVKNSRMKWFDEHLTFLFEYGGHEFFTSPM